MKMPGNLGLFHIVGIGGIGMSSIAEVMISQGLKVQGSDLSANANVERLRAKGVQVFQGHDASNIDNVDFLVISTAVKRGNPELDAARDRGIPVIRRAEMLAEIMRGKSTISITGTHGKTTTTSMVATILEKGNFDPTVINGGIVPAWQSNARIGRSDWMVVEADESDGTFIRLPSQIGIVTNIDPEHMDFYGTEEKLHAAFRTFFRNIPFYGTAIAGIDHPVVRALVNELSESLAGRRLLTYGIASDSDVRLENILPDRGGIIFDVGLSDRVKGGARWLQDVRLPVPGHYNAMNALAAIAAATELGMDDAHIRDALLTYSGVKRRFTKTGEWRGIGIYDDYAHHPAEISAVLQAARSATGGRVIAVMQPHRYTRLQSLFEDFASSFKDADSVIVTPVFPAGEAPIQGVDNLHLANSIVSRGNKNVMASEGGAALTHEIANIAESGDLVIFLGAGNITEWAQNLPAWLENMSVNSEMRA